MKKHISTILIVALFVIGLGILLYPTISNWFREKSNARVISRYEESVESSGAKRIEELLKAAEAYNQKLTQNKQAFFHPDQVPGYDATLDITGTGVMGYISIEKIDVELPIYHTVDDTVLQIGVGHLPGSSLPVGGTSTHAVLSGHRGLPSARLFTDLDKMEVGDTFVITVLDRRITYRVDQIKTVLPEETRDLQIVDGKDYCTLMTCTPYGVNSHRLLIRGARVENVAEEQVAYVRNEALRIEPTLVAIVLGVPALLLVLLLVLLRDRRKSGRSKKAKEVDDVEKTE